MRFGLFLIESPHRAHVGPSGREAEADSSASLTSPRYLGGVARAAEEIGFDLLTFPEHVVLPTQYQSRYPYQQYQGDDFKRYPYDETSFPEPITALTFVAAVTERIRLGTSVLILPQRNPVVLAKQLATLDALSEGRLAVTVGIGWFREEFEAIGAPWPARGRRADEYIEAMRALWRDEVASYEGETVRFDRIRCLPKPWRPEGPEIYVGGHSEAAARRAGRLGDGFMPLGFGGYGTDPKPLIAVTGRGKGGGARPGRPRDRARRAAGGGRGTAARGRGHDAGALRALGAESGGGAGLHGADRGARDREGLSEPMRGSRSR